MFALRTAEDAAMVGSWRVHLDQYSAVELETASVAMLKNPPDWRDKHVAGLLRILSANRASMSRSFGSQGDDDATVHSCGVCHGTGLLEVPHPQCLTGGEFLPGPAGYKATVAVTCSCERGRRKQATFDGDLKKPMALTHYESTICMGWPALMEEWAKEKRAASGIVAQARDVDKKLGPLVQSLAARMSTNTKN